MKNIKHVQKSKNTLKNIENFKMETKNLFDISACNTQFIRNVLYLSKKRQRTCKRSNDLDWSKNRKKNVYWKYWFSKNKTVLEAQMWKE